jgi:hypothetical protein
VSQIKFSFLSIILMLADVAESSSTRSTRIRASGDLADNLCRRGRG